MKEIKKNTKYKIKSKSKYFKGKYGTFNPEIVIEDLCKNVLRTSWMFADGNPVAMIYGMRSGLDGLPTDDNVYYGKINGLAELVHISELL